MRWVVVEMDEEVSYGEDGAHGYKVIGKVYGPWAIEEEAQKWARKQGRGVYDPDYEVREITPVLQHPRSSTP